MSLTGLLWVPLMSQILNFLSACKMAMDFQSPMKAASTSLMGTCRSSSSFFTFLPYQSSPPKAKLQTMGTTPHPQKRNLSRSELAAAHVNLLCFSPKNKVQGRSYCYSSLDYSKFGAATQWTLPFDRQYLTKACGWMYSDLNMLSSLLMATISCVSPEEQAPMMFLAVAQISLSLAGSRLMLLTGALARVPKRVRFLCLSLVWNWTTWLQPVPTQTLVMLKPIYRFIITHISYITLARGALGQKQPERVKPPQMRIMMKQMTSSTTKKSSILIFQFSHVMACLMVLVELTISKESADMVSVFLTRMSIFYYLSSNFCRSSLRIWFTSSVSFHSLATLSTSSGELQSSIFPRSVLANSIAPYICIFPTVSILYWLRNIFLMLSRYAKAMRSEYFWSAITMYMRSSQRTQKMQLLAENLQYFREGVHRLRICWAVRTKFPLKGVNSVRRMSYRAITVQIKDISQQTSKNQRPYLIFLCLKREAKNEVVGD